MIKPLPLELFVTRYITSAYVLLIKSLRREASPLGPQQRDYSRRNKFAESRAQTKRDKRLCVFARVLIQLFIHT